MSKQGTFGKRKHITLTILQKLETIRWLECGRSRSIVMASYNIGSSTIYGISKQKGQLRSFLAPSESAKALFKQQPILAQMDNVFYKWFTAMRSAGKPPIGHTIIDKAPSFYD
jgi:hypothetical protein